MAETVLQQSSIAGGSAPESLPLSLLVSLSQSVPESMERGPRYKAYAELRESRLRNKYRNKYLQQISSVAGGSALESLLHALDPISLLLSQNPVSQSVPESMERGPRYKAYAELRESRLRNKYRNKYLQKSPDQPLEEGEEEKESKPTPTKKQDKFQANLISGQRKKVSASSSCVVAQSVPHFSAVLRKEKENRKPPATRLEMTPPWSKGNHGGAVSNSRGNKSASAGKKNSCNGGGGGLMARKSLEELKGLSSAAGNAIIGGGAENRAGGRSGRATAKAVLGYRHF